VLSSLPTIPPRARVGERRRSCTGTGGCQLEESLAFDRLKNFPGVVGSSQRIGALYFRILFLKKRSPRRESARGLPARLCKARVTLMLLFGEAFRQAAENAFI